MRAQTRKVAVVFMLVAGLSAGGFLVANRGRRGADAGGGGEKLTQTQMRYALMDRFGPLHYCDPDSFPVAREGSEESGARSWWSAVDKTGEELTAIRRHLGLAGGNLTEGSVVRVYQDHKRLQAIPLEPAGTEFRFAVRTEVAGKGEAIATDGLIGADGRVRITGQRREPSFGCPICLSGATLIDTPLGAIPVASLRSGMPVWTVDAAGGRVAGTVVRTVRRAVPSSHPIIRVTLADGRRVAASPGHPTREGRLFASLAPGDIVDGIRIASIEVTVSAEPFTYDLLPSGPSGAYWADGVLIGTTLGPR